MIARARNNGPSGPKEEEMKKNLWLSVIIVLMIFCVGSTAYANEKLGSFYLGAFTSEKANWTDSMDSQLLSAMANVPAQASLKIFGHTDNSGPKAFNEGLADKRAKLVASQIKKLSPEISITEVTGIIYQAGSNDVDYKMARVEVEVPDGWLITNKELANEFKKGIVDLRAEQIKQGQSIQNLEKLTQETSQGVKSVTQKVNGVERELETAKFQANVEAEKNKFNIFLILCVVLVILIVLVFVYVAIRRGLKKTGDKIEAVNEEIQETVVSTVLSKAFRFKVESEGKLYLVPIKQEANEKWSAPFITEKKQPVQFIDLKATKKNVKNIFNGKQKDFFRSQVDKLIENGVITVMEQ
ncbi:hypothetical protein DRH27_00585 [Candidatus Falkowbacteria bacterium]|nr:MAG: hypothetical protein DRH27_00585 [Candidatus Falkowbacteria bacterium]